MHAGYILQLSYTKCAILHRVVSTPFSAASVNKKVFEFLWLEDFNPSQIDSYMFRDNLN